MLLLWLVDRRREPCNDDSNCSNVANESYDAMSWMPVLLMMLIDGVVDVIAVVVAVAV